LAHCLLICVSLISWYDETLSGTKLIDPIGHQHKQHQRLLDTEIFVNQFQRVIDPSAPPQINFLPHQFDAVSCVSCPVYCCRNKIDSGIADMKQMRGHDLIMHCRNMSWQTPVTFPVT